MLKHKKTILICFAILVIGLRLSLPFIIKNQFEKGINQLPQYRCNISDIDLILYRGSLMIDSLEVFITTNEVEEPFVNLPLTDISIEWSALFDGAIVGEIFLQDPKLNFNDGEKESEQQAGDADWTQPILDMIPVRINRFEIKNGSLNFENKTSSPPVNLSITNWDLIATNLTNATDNTEQLPSSLTTSANIFDSGKARISGNLNIIKKMPDMDLSYKLESIDLTETNDFTKAYASFDFEKGYFAIIGEYAMRDGKIKGYIKPVLEHVKILDMNEDKGTLNTLWQAFIGGITELTENQKKDQTATKVTLSGDVSNVDTDVLDIITNLFKNGFIEAFDKEIENTVDFKDVPKE
ncbi:protein of unknown function [Reichenbachiella agariperforans]|uniref:DUF748 domain-containing protein n=1 Tax=Reichenbachiella agariperforans TaxID=156994 RepID=A0A1M6WET9_REIAG|nr:DUF748 domain-containing protein [Reichenbachiella agariperforans]SHK92282.1 protein of unknown function [Reichenbachiella agariperforans]